MLLITRDQAIKVVTDHIQNKGLQKHCLAVGAAMRALYHHFYPSQGKVPTIVGERGTDADLWEIIGILHDADWEETKDVHDQHTRKTVEWVRSFSADLNPETMEIITRTILSHNYFNNGEPEPNNVREWALTCCDELTGIIVANALIMPSKKLADISVESVIKKMNSKSFAAAIDREGIRLCETKLNIPLPEFVGIVLKGMQSQSTILGL